MKKLWVGLSALLLTSLVAVKVAANPPIIWDGTRAKTLTPSLSLYGEAYLLTGTDNPTVVAKDAPRGSLYLRTGALGGATYQKSDDGLSTNWSALVGGVIGAGISTDNALIRWDGVNGNIVQNSSATLDDAGKLTLPSLLLSGATASTVPYFDASKNLVSSSVTPTQLGYLDATSSVQTQLNGKEPTLGFTAVPNTRTINGYDLTANRSLTATDIGLGSVTNEAQIPLSYLDTDGTLAGDSDIKVPSQKAVKTYVTSGLSTKEPTLGFTPENVANKDSDGTLAANSDTNYATQKATKTYADTKVAKTTTINGYDLSVNRSLTYTDVGADVSGASATVQGNLNTHTALTTTAHGGIVASTDPRLTDSRTPLAHASSHAEVGSDPITITPTQAGLSAVTNDAQIKASVGMTKGDLVSFSGSATPVRVPGGAYGQVLTYDDSQTASLKWSNVSGGINYVTKSDAEGNATTGFVRYVDAAGTSPVDGTGGSPNAGVTWTATSSSPLRGTYSFLLTRDAANRQGEGVSYGFTIDAADQAKVLTAEFDYQVASGTFDDLDLSVWIYDVTNSQLIQPAPYVVQNAVGPQHWKGEFQTNSNSTSYRLILHMSDTGTSAWTVKFDNFQVGPGKKVFGAPTVDMIAYTPTLTTSGGGAITLNATGKQDPTGWYRRVGDSVEITVNFRNGTGGVASGSAGQVQVSLPPGILLDTTKATLGTDTLYKIGSASSYNLVANQYLSEQSAMYYGGQMLVSNGGTGQVILVSNLLAGAGIQIQAKFPVLGWSSSLQISDNAETRVVAAMYNGTPTGTLNGSSNPATFPTKVQDTHGAYSAGSYTVPVSGFYDVDAQIIATGTITVGTHYLQVGIAVGGANRVGTLNYATSTNEISTKASGTIYCNVGDVITITTATTITSPAFVSTFRNYLSIKRVSGPSQIAASETVAAQYTKATAESTTANNPINFATASSDTHSSVTTGASWKFTAPTSGRYHVTMIIASDTLTDAVVYLNGSPTYQMGYISSTTHYSNLSITLRLLAGQYFDVRPTGTFATSGSGSQISIERTGNY